MDRGSIEVSNASIDRHSIAGVNSTHDPRGLEGFKIQNISRASADLEPSRSLHKMVTIYLRFDNANKEFKKTMMAVSMGMPLNKSITEQNNGCVQALYM